MSRWAGASKLQIEDRAPPSVPLVVVGSQTSSTNSLLLSAEAFDRKLQGQARREQVFPERHNQASRSRLTRASRADRRGQVAPRCSIAVVVASSTPSFLLRAFLPTQSQPTSPHRRAANRDKGFDCYRHGSATATVVAAQSRWLGV
jgi:hypothetical protein